MKDNNSISQWKFQFLLIVVLFILSIDAWAQETLEYKTVNENALQIKNENDALAKIYSNLELSFECSTLPLNGNDVEVKFSNGMYTYYVYLKPIAHTCNLIVKANKCVPLSIVIKDIVPKAVFVYSVYTKQENTGVDVTDAVGDFDLVSVPSGAEISIKGQPAFNGHTPYSFHDQTAIRYLVTLRKPEYYDTTLVIDIRKNKKQNLLVPLRARFGFLTLNTSQENTLFVDGTEMQYQSGSKIKLFEGKRKITIARKYYQPYIDSLEIAGAIKPVEFVRNVTLPPYKGRLLVNTFPSGASVLIDGVLKGFTPYNDELNAGAYNIDIKKELYKDVHKSIEFFKDDAVGIEEKLQRYGTLNLRSSPSGAMVYSNGELLGTTPLEKDLPAGSYQLKVVKEHYRTETVHCDISWDLISNSYVQLPANGKLIIRGAPGASCSIDRKFKGQLNGEMEIELPPGDHKLWLWRYGYDDEEISFTLEPEVKTLDVELTKSEGKFFRWNLTGNERIQNLTPSWGGYIKCHFSKLTPEFLSSAAKFPVHSSAGGMWPLGTGVAIWFEPFMMQLDFNYLQIIAQDIKGGDRVMNFADSAMFHVYFGTAKFGYTPFVLFERIYPTFGIMGQYTNATISDHFLKDAYSPELGGTQTQRFDFGYYTDVMFKLGSVISLSVGYEIHPPPNSFENSYYINLIITTRSNYDK
ncbi:MAG: PEGA domain-containing protein [Ignavibacteria bacterium]|nr:PEGA domain-containing protein [Ignavibacteria bacterium]